MSPTNEFYKAKSRMTKHMQHYLLS